MLLVFGRGVLCADDGYVPTASSAARVRAAVDHVVARRAAGATRPRVVFSGGWAEACDGAPQPPAGCREGDLMLRDAVAAGLDRYADLHTETRSSQQPQPGIRA